MKQNFMFLRASDCNFKAILSRYIQLFFIHFSFQKSGFSNSYSTLSGVPT